jgi:tRNA (guanine9-N1)-methyltransferase
MPIMADVGEHPSKRRKLSSPGDKEDFNEAPESSLKSDDDTEKSNTPPGLEDEAEENYQSKIDTQVQAQEPPKISKNQLKKLRKREQWEAGKDDRRVKRREKHKEKQARKAEQRAIGQEKVASSTIEAQTQDVPKSEPGKRPRRPIPVPVSFILDCDFEEYMTEKELISLGAQLTRCYSDNRSNPYRAHLAISSWNGKLKERFETVLAGNHLGWKGVKFLEADFVSAAEVLDGIMRGKEGGQLVGAVAEDVKPPLESKTVVRPVDGHVPKGNTSAPESNDRLLKELVQEGEVAAPGPESTDSKDEKHLLDEHIPKGRAPAPALESGYIEQTTSPIQELKSSDGKDQDAKPEETLPSIATLKTKPSIIYLTSDSEHTLSRLEPNTSYIIGGIVDKNRHKGLCYKRARERGIATAKLPIGEYMTMQSRSVLAVNHVIEIMLKWLETGDWGSAFLRVIPKRKEAKLRVKGEEENGRVDGEEDEGKVDGDGEYCGDGIE